MDINIQQVQAQGLGFDSQIHRWGFLGLLIVSLRVNRSNTT
jgi:hypothetical protein